MLAKFRFPEVKITFLEKVSSNKDTFKIYMKVVFCKKYLLIFSIILVN